MGQVWSQSGTGPPATRGLVDQSGGPGMVPIRNWAACNKGLGGPVRWARYGPNQELGGLQQGAWWTSQVGQVWSQSGTGPPATRVLVDQSGGPGMVPIRDWAACNKGLGGPVRWARYGPNQELSRLQQGAWWTSQVGQVWSQSGTGRPATRGLMDQSGGPGMVPIRNWAACNKGLGGPVRWARYGPNQGLGGLQQGA